MEHHQMTALINWWEYACLISHSCGGVCKRHYGQNLAEYTYCNVLTISLNNVEGVCRRFPVKRLLVFLSVSPFATSTYNAAHGCPRSIATAQSRQPCLHSPKPNHTTSQPPQHPPCAFQSYSSSAQLPSGRAKALSSLLASPFCVLVYPSMTMNHCPPS